jgi:hypothetical protein
MPVILRTMSAAKGTKDLEILRLHFVPVQDDKKKSYR